VRCSTDAGTALRRSPAILAVDAIHYHGDPVSEAKRQERRAQATATQPDTIAYDEKPGVKHRQAADDAPAVGTLAGTVALLRFDIDAARAAIRYRDERIAALEATLRQVLQQGDHETDD